MSTTTPLLNEENLRRELDWLEKCLSARIAQELAIPEPPVLHPDTAFSNTIDQHELEVPERLFLALAIATEIRPDMLHDIAQQSSMAPALGLRIHQATRTFRPTFRTAVFLVAGPATARFVAISKRFCLENVLFKVRILEAGGHHEAGGVHGRTFQLHPAAWQEIIYGTPFQPRISTDFPAELLTTKMEWKDLILGESTRKQVEEIHVWLRNTQKFAKDEILRTRLKPGYRALFHGPPGTGKTLTATLLGKATGRDVYRVDLSQIVSKYIGETEKNLRRIFDLAETRDWILFFDEADSLFGKRGKVNDARDRYANQEISYLLQRVETFDGLVILASNLRQNIDEAFARRFQGMVYFPLPDELQRIRLWLDSLPASCELDSNVRIEIIAQRYKLSGGAILNISAYAALMAFERDDFVVREADLMEGIQREYSKEGKLI